ncbi:MAG: hypothetical protein ACWA5L_05865 [bacterium]
MTIYSSLRNGLLISSACLALVACTGSGSNANSGSTGPVTIGGGGGGGSTNKVSLVPTGFTCPTGTSEGTITRNGTDITACVLPAGTFTSDITLPGLSGGQEVGYAIAGSVFVGDNLISNASGSSATLTIEAGAVLFGQNGEDALFVSPGSQLVANGSAANPIIMTSASDIADGDWNDGLIDGSATTRGEWGGLVLSGLAPINDCDVTSATPGSTACNKTGEGGSGLFGGDEAAYSCGSLAYVRVQYAGYKFNDEDELNGIAFQGCGEGTTASYLQIHNNQDDGVEFFGGGVDVDHIVVTGAGDDSIDWTDGWYGDLQYALVIQDDSDGDRGIEGDNRSNDTDITPRSMPNISNFTFFGGATGSDGLKLRAGTAGNIANGIVIGFSDGVDFDQNTSSGTGPTVSSIFAGSNSGFKDIAVVNGVAAAADTMDGIIPGAAETAVPVTDNSVGNDLETPSFIGAFDPATETNASNWTTGWILGQTPGAGSTGCPTGTAQTAEAVPAGRSEARICLVPNSIVNDLTLTNGNLYKFSGSVFVGTDTGADAANPDAGAVTATLTIEPGVTLYGESGEDAIVISRGSKIIAAGTAAAPVIMTSESDIQSSVLATARGEWGGLVINGRAPINDCDVTTVDPIANPELCEKTGEGGSGLFGGNDAADNSGVLNYVQVKYAGFKFNDEDELNGIAFQGVGSGTDIDYVQVHNNQDDGIELFGGAAELKHLVLTGNGDDSLDWTDGWVGTAQYVIIVQSDDDGDRGIEGDNRSNDTDILPRTNPVISNVTILRGATGSDGVKLRAGTSGELYNFIIAGYNATGGDGIDFDQNSALGVTPTFYSTYVVDNTASVKDTEGTLFLTANGNKDGEAAAEDSTLTASGTTAPLVPGANENAVTPTTAPGLEATSYIGAVADSSDDWYKGWTFGL